MKPHIRVYTAAGGSPDQRAQQPVVLNHIDMTILQAMMSFI